MSFDAPKNSLPHQSLIEAVSHAKYDGLSLRKLLWLVNAHPSLIAHARVFEHISLHLNSAIFTVESLNWAGDWTSEIGSWKRICNWISTNRLKLTLLPGLSGFDYEVEDKHPIVGEYVNRHGVVAAIWSQHEGLTQYPRTLAIELAAARIHFEIQGHLLATYIDSRHRLSTIQYYEEYTEDDESPVAPARTGAVGLAIRELSLSKYSPFIERFPSAKSTEDFAQLMAKCPSIHLDLPDANAADAHRYFATLRRYFYRFGRVLNGLPVHKPNRKGWGGSGGHELRHGFVPAIGPKGVYFSELAPVPQDSEIPRLVGQGALVSLDSEPSGGLDDIEASGLAPTETLEPLFQLFTPDEIRGRLYAARYQRLAAEAAAQSLPFDYSQLTPQERHLINARADEKISDFLDSDNDSTHARQSCIAALIVRAMLCLGQPLTSAWGLQTLWVFDDSPDNSVAPIDDAITLVLGAPSQQTRQNARVIGFCIPGIMPNYQSSLSPLLEEVDEDGRDSFVLPDTLYLGEQLLAYLRHESIQSLNSFGIGIVAATSLVSKFVQSFHDRRISPEKITNVLPSIVKSQSGDQSLAWLMTADFRNATQPRMHYTRHSVQVIVKAYIQASRRVIGTKRTVFHGTRDHPFESIDTSVVGARFVLSFDQLQDIIRRLIELLSKRYKATWSRAEIRRYHNLYVLYVALSQSLATSIRAVTEPNEIYLAWLGSIAVKCDDRLFSSISDKDTMYSDRSRLIPIIAPLAAQFSHYKLHIEVLPLRLPDLAPWISMHGSDNPIFIISPEFTAESLTPTWIRDSLKELTKYEIPVNFHRAFLRTDLLKRNCPAEAIDAFLGHANFGELPFSKLSTFDYYAHFEILQKALISVHGELGLRPIPSRLVPHKQRMGKS